MYSSAITESTKEIDPRGTLELLCFPDPRLREKSTDISFETEDPTDI